MKTLRRISTDRQSCAGISQFLHLMTSLKYLRSNKGFQVARPIAVTAGLQPDVLNLYVLFGKTMRHQKL
jgi:hypothetical protein